MNPKLKEKLMESLTAVLPITLIVLALSVVLVPMDVGTAVMFTVGAVLLVFGMGLFQLVVSVYFLSTNFAVAGVHYADDWQCLQKLYHRYARLFQYDGRLPFA